MGDSISASLLRKKGGIVSDALGALLSPPFFPYRIQMLTARLLDSLAEVFRHAAIFIFVAAPTVAGFVASGNFGSNRVGGFGGEEFFQAVQHGNSLHKKRGGQLCRLPPFEYRGVRELQPHSIGKIGLNARKSARHKGQERLYVLVNFHILFAINKQYPTGRI